ncbi:IclR family transcriptional regulator [Halalkalibacter oceani]|uniref:IclR family transcriptional regulator n=1 Tax=Halalkalibacter oceani TaxID=1653776 RepID=UPI0033927F4B
MSEYSSLAAVERTLVIIKALVGKTNGASVSKLMADTGISKSVVSRILKTLKENHYVEQDPETRFYRLTYDYINLALLHYHALGIDGMFLPTLRKIAQELKELVQITFVRNEKIYFVQKAEGDNPLKVADMVGKEAPLHCSAAGKLWLSSLPEEEVKRIIGERGMKRYTEKTITELQELLNELASIRQSGYAVSREEFHQGVVGVAVPILFHYQPNKITAIIVIAAPSIRMTETKMKNAVNVCHKHIHALHTQQSATQ